MQIRDQLPHLVVVELSPEARHFTFDAVRDDVQLRVDHVVPQPPAVREADTTIVAAAAALIDEPDIQVQEVALGNGTLANTPMLPWFVPSAVSVATMSGANAPAASARVSAAL